MTPKKREAALVMALAHCNWQADLDRWHFLRHLHDIGTVKIWRAEWELRKRWRYRLMRLFRRIFK